MFRKMIIDEYDVWRLSGEIDVPCFQCLVCRSSRGAETAGHARRACRSTHILEWAPGCVYFFVGKQLYPILVLKERREKQSFWGRGAFPATAQKARRSGGQSVEGRRTSHAYACENCSRQDKRVVHERRLEPAVGWSYFSCFCFGSCAAIGKGLRRARAPEHAPEVKQSRAYVR